MEEFQHLLDPSLVDIMKKSMYNATVGDGYRVGGVDGDNRESQGFANISPNSIPIPVYPIYSNPWSVDSQFYFLQLNPRQVHACNGSHLCRQHDVRCQHDILGQRVGS